MSGLVLFGQAFLAVLFAHSVQIVQDEKKDKVLQTIRSSSDEGEFIHACWCLRTGHLAILEDTNGGVILLHLYRSSDSSASEFLDHPRWLHWKDIEFPTRCVSTSASFSFPLYLSNVNDVLTVLNTELQVFQIVNIVDDADEKRRISAFLAGSADEEPQEERGAQPQNQQILNASLSHGSGFIATVEKMAHFLRLRITDIGGLFEEGVEAALSLSATTDLNKKISAHSTSNTNDNNVIAKLSWRPSLSEGSCELLLSLIQHGSSSSKASFSSGWGFDSSVKIWAVCSGQAPAVVTTTFARN